MKVIFDNNLSPALARALRELFKGEHEIVALRDRFHGAPRDVDWITELSRDGRWIVISGERISTTGVIGPSVGDFDGNGSTDILWRDSNSNVAIWLMNGLQPMPPPVLLGNVPTGWTIQETGDFNGDGKSDILWRDRTGNVAVWFMNGTQVAPASIASVTTDWVIQGAGAD